MAENQQKRDQRRAPIYEALEQFRNMRVVPFDVPGHKRGRGNPELAAFLGQQCVGVDVNSMKPLDNLCHPVSVIGEAEQLAAEAFGAAHAFLMVGGTTSSVQSMVLTTCKRGDEIILPRPLFSRLNFSAAPRRKYMKTRSRNTAACIFRILLTAQWSADSRRAF